MANKEDTLYVRNGRPNTVVFHFNGVRHALQHRGNRQDSTALPVEALGDTTVSRWLREGKLEKISRESYMQLGRRSVDVLPNEYIKRSSMRNSRGGGDVVMNPADADTTRSKTQVLDGDVHKHIRDKSTTEWAGDLMSTEEELESAEFSVDQQNYPSKHRDNETRRQMGY